MAKNQFIRARVAGWEKDCIRRKADAAHMTESEFVRRAAMDREVTVIEGMDELLRELRSDPNLKSTTVVVLTTSADERDKVEAYNLNVAGYLVKPVTFVSFVDLMVALSRWFTLVELA